MEEREGKKMRESNLLHKTFPEGYPEDFHDRFPLDVDETIWWPTNGMELKEGDEGDGSRQMKKLFTK